VSSSRYAGPNIINIGNFRRKLIPALTRAIQELMVTLPTVLFVDDDEDLRALFGIYLEDSYRPILANDTEEALNRLGDDVDVGILDRRMPWMSGDELLDEIRGRWSFRVAMITGVEPDMNIVDKDFGDHLTNPVSKKELVATVEQMSDLGICDEKLNQYLTLAKKRALLLEEYPSDQIAARDELGQLEEEIENFGQEFDALRNGFDRKGEFALFTSSTSSAG